LEVLVAFAAANDAEIAEHARETLNTQDTVLLRETLRSEDVPKSVLSYYAGKLNIEKSLHEAIILNPQTPQSTMVTFARNTQDGELLELISMNQQLLIRTPALIDAIIGNPNRTSEAERRAAET
ncbi:MAG TPA: hypothetical protein DDW24_09875, partial [Blastocatellia bacterium]|nr:hypothetical protein [Blastocatellia bacterium]